MAALVIAFLTGLAIGALIGGTLMAIMACASDTDRCEEVERCIRKIKGDGNS